MSEKTAYNKFRQKIYKFGDRINRIENMVGLGTPDVNVCLKGGYEFWVEIKSPKEPKRNSTPLFGSNHKLTKSQINWFKQQDEAGGIGFVLIVTDKRWLLIFGRHIDNINDMTIDELLEISIWNAKKPIRKKEIWNNLRQSLIGIS